MDEQAAGVEKQAVRFRQDEMNPAVARVAFAVATLFATNVVLAQKATPLPKLTEIRVKSTADGTSQPSMLWTPKSATKKPTPLFVFLHSWSGNYKQNNSKWLAEAVKRNWIFLHPDFRGRNDHPAACGSKLARQDVLDAIDFVAAKYKVDTTRVYLAGASGGGHMAMLMAGYHPNRFSAVSAWVGISDLAKWHRFHTRNGKKGRYAAMTEKSLGGPPGKSKRVDAEYKARSPIFHLQNVGNLPIDLAAGVKDGKTGSVPIMHTLDAFNVIANSGKRPTVSRREIDELWKAGKLSNPKPGDRVKDDTYGRTILLRRTAGPARVTIFDGGHEGLPKAAASWLARQRRATRKP